MSWGTKVDIRWLSKILHAESDESKPGTSWYSGLHIPKVNPILGLLGINPCRNPKCRLDSSGHVHRGICRLQTLARRPGLGSKSGSMRDPQSGDIPDIPPNRRTKYGDTNLSQLDVLPDVRLKFSSSKGLSIVGWKFWYQHISTLSTFRNWQYLALKSHFVSVPALKTPVFVQVLYVTVPSCSSYTHNVLVSCFGIRPELAPASVPFYLSMLSQSNPSGTVFWELQAHQSCYLQWKRQTGIKIKLIILVDLAV